MGIADQLSLLVPAGRVKRYHNTPMLRNQTVGEHTWLVTWLALELCADLPNPAEVLLVLTAALLHDVPEAATGDMPAPVKRAMGVAGLDDLRAFEARTLERHGLSHVVHPAHKRIIKLADVMEGYLNCSVEVATGNALADAVRHKYLTYLLGMEPWTDLERSVISAVIAFKPHYYEAIV